jgi:hypothetical protein
LPEFTATTGDIVSTEIGEDSHSLVHSIHHIVMALLPDYIDFDPGLVAHENRQKMSKLQNAEGIRLWARYLVTAGHSRAITIPRAWCDFFIAILLNPSRFAWAKVLLESEAGKIVLSDKTEGDMLTFCITQKMPHIRATSM